MATLSFSLSSSSSSSSSTKLLEPTSSSSSSTCKFEKDETEMLLKQVASVETRSHAESITIYIYLRSLGLSKDISDVFIREAIDAEVVEFLLSRDTKTDINRFDEFVEEYLYERFFSFCQIHFSNIDPVLLNKRNITILIRETLVAIDTHMKTIN